MVYGVDICYSFASFLEQLSYAIKDSLMALICSSNSPSVRPLSWKRPVTDTTANGPVKRPKDVMNKPKVHPLPDDAPSTNVEKIEEDTKLKEEESGNTDASFDSSNKSHPGLKVNKKRPAMLVIPGNSAGEAAFEEKKRDDRFEKALEVEGNAFCLFSKKGGSRHAMEDGYGTINATIGDSQLAFFGVYDGHGGRAAVDYISDNLGKNIISQISQMEKGEKQLEMAIKAGYLTTDEEFISQEMSSGACAATALILNGELFVANAGDCRIVISQNGVATALTIDHSASREDERARIENLGGFVSCSYGSVWRVQDSLAVSRAFGDILLKKWVISEPEITKVQLTGDRAFLVMASDGLWNKVSNQEAVDYVLQHDISMESCRELVELSWSRGSRDDITVMLVDLQKIVQLAS
ncbi:hypothetical protein LUZ61_007585 [Rhynchospora tenuis]|uniref:protein-serine/threonine phosphatase n=1 Tax=Rhynchospora tenuis TaxID=198213 RepID=A0AAD5ZTP9_9POAL|nr:hypothetical protein LUZ61_007585 [Rhynchospora tenuis]